MDIIPLDSPPSLTLTLDGDRRNLVDSIFKVSGRYYKIRETTYSYYKAKETETVLEGYSIEPFPGIESVCFEYIAGS